MFLSETWGINSISFIRGAIHWRIAPRMVYGLFKTTHFY